MGQLFRMRQDMAARCVEGMWVDQNGSSSSRPCQIRSYRSSSKPWQEEAMPRGYCERKKDSRMLAAVKEAFYGNREPYSHFGPLPPSTSSHCSEDISYLWNCNGVLLDTLAAVLLASSRVTQPHGFLLVVGHHKFAQG